MLCLEGPIAGSTEEFDITIFETCSHIGHKIPMQNHFTADNHFGHESIITLSQRPFATVEEMDEAMIANWNAVVQRGDNVWHVGDFAHRIDVKRKRAIFS